MEFDCPFAAPGQWLKGNLHVHTTASDGVVEPQQRVAAYAERGYDFLALTDHGVVADVEALEPGPLVVLRGIEAHAPMPTGGTQAHIVAVGLPAGFRPPEAQHAQTLIDALAATGAPVIVAHPYWCGQTSRDLEVLHGYHGIEVFNTTCLRGIGKGKSAVHWDELLSQGRRLFGVAVDDAHGATHDAFQGWIMVKAAERTAEAVVAAVRAGRFYASCGPAFEAVWVEEGAVHARTSPVAHISFVCDGPRGGHCFHEDGSPVTEAAYRPPADARFVRVEATDERGRTAWCNPLFSVPAEEEPGS